MGGLKNSCDEKDDDQNEDDDHNEDDDSDNDSDDFENRDFDEKDPKLVPELGKVASKVRKIVKLFRKLPVGNDHNLQPEIKLSFGKEKALLLDCKIRWNSSLQMLKRVYELPKEVKIAMVQLDPHFDISNEELVRIKELFDALAPIKMAVEYLCREDAYLLLAGKVTEFTTKKLRDFKTSISLELVEVFQARFRERRNPELIHLLKCLKNPDFVYENQEDQFGIKIRKTKITALVPSLLQRLYHQGNTEEMKWQWRFLMILRRISKCSF